MAEAVIEVIVGGPLRVEGVPSARLIRDETGWRLGPPLATDADLGVSLRGVGFDAVL